MNYSSAFSGGPVSNSKSDANVWQEILSTDVDVDIVDNLLRAQAGNCSLSLSENISSRLNWFCINVVDVDVIVDVVV